MNTITEDIKRINEAIAHLEAVKHSLERVASLTPRTSNIQGPEYCDSLPKPGEWSQTTKLLTLIATGSDREQKPCYFEHRQKQGQSISEWLSTIPVTLDNYNSIVHDAEFSSVMIKTNYGLADVTNKND